VIDGVLTLRASKLDHFRVLRATMQAHYRVPGTVHVIVPDNEVCQVIEAVGMDTRYFVHPESRLLDPCWRGDRADGWHRQQVLKLGAARVVGTAHYLTLDDDVLVVRPVVELDLVARDGRAAASTYRMGSVPHDQRWYRASAALLGRPVPASVMCVTPAVLSTSAVLHGLLPELAAGRPEENAWQARLREALALDQVWTEYSLYRCHLQGAWDRHHVERRLDGNGAWSVEDIRAWDAGKSFCQEDESGADWRFPFTVVQSYLPASLTWEKVRRHLPADVVERTDREFSRTK
jgi:hypothetical protein